MQQKRMRCLKVNVFTEPIAVFRASYILRNWIINTVQKWPGIMNHLMRQPAAMALPSSNSILLVMVTTSEQIIEHLIIYASDGLQRSLHPTNNSSIRVKGTPTESASGKAATEAAALRDSSKNSIKNMDNNEGKNNSNRGSSSCDSSNCDSSNCDNSNCDSSNCDNSSCDSSNCDSSNCDSSNCDSSNCDSSNKGSISNANNQRRGAAVTATTG